MRAQEENDAPSDDIVVLVQLPGMKPIGSDQPNDPDAVGAQELRGLRRRIYAIGIDPLGIEKDANS
mgnify:CR=1 FL=1